MTSPRVDPMLRNSAAHVFVDDIESPVLSDHDAHHLANVLRLRSGESVSVCDGAGRWRLCRFDGGALTVSSDIVTELLPHTRTTVALVPVKGDRTESAVEKLVEVGIDNIVIVAPTRNSVVRWDSDKATTNIERLRRIARSAAMQSRRVVVPTVEGPVDLDQLLARPGVALADPDGDVLSGSDHTIVVGPEGGFDPDEVAAARRRVSLGAHVLRADTAAVVAGILLVTHRSNATDNTE